MATASKVIDEDILNCSICLGQFVTPKYLPCLHTFCETCLQTYISAEISKGNSDSFLCPVCRISVQPVDAESPAEKWAEKMPNNHLIASLLDTKWQTQSYQLCEPCKEADEENKVAFWCMECPEGLCESCASSHRRMKISKHHKIVPISEICEESLKMADIDEPCHKHKGKVLEVYCIDHSALCCVICLATNHRKCENIKTIDEMAEEYAKNENTEEFSRQLEIVEKQVKKLFDGKQQNIDFLDKKYNDILTSMTDRVASVRAKLDQSLDKFTKDLKHLHKTERQNLIDRRDIIECFERTVTTDKKMLETVARKGSAKQLFVTTEKIKSQLSGHMKQLKDDLKDDEMVDYQCRADDIINDVSKLDSAGYIELRSKPCPDEVKSVIQAVRCCCRSNNFEGIEAVKVADIKSQGSYFIGGTFLGNGNVIFADCNKSQLKIYDITGNIVTTFKVNGQPLDVAVWSQDEIYVSFVGSILRKYILDGEPIEISQIEIGEKYICLCKKDENLILSSKYKVEIIEESGAVIKSFLHATNVNFSHADKFKDKIYFTDKREIVCCCLDGSEIFRHQIQCENNDNIVGIAVNAQNVYACCFDAGCVYLTSKDGRKGRILLSELNGIKHPIAIGFDVTGKYFFVTSNKEEVTATIYKLI